MCCFMLVMGSNYHRVESGKLCPELTEGPSLALHWLSITLKYEYTSQGLRVIRGNHKKAGGLGDLCALYRATGYWHV